MRERGIIMGPESVRARLALTTTTWGAEYNEAIGMYRAALAPFLPGKEGEQTTAPAPTTARP